MSIFDWILSVFYRPTLERPSPKIRIKGEQVKLIDGTLTVTGLERCFIASILPSNSMEPNIDDGMLVILDPVHFGDLTVGDIIWYQHPQFEAFHRIVEISIDTEWYCKTKGDNNTNVDPVKIRPEHIKGVWRITID